MNDEANQEHRSEQIARTFALLTAKLEDATTLAVDGQAPLADEELRVLALQITDLASEAATIAGALAALLARPSSEPTLKRT